MNPEELGIHNYKVINGKLALTGDVRISVYDVKNGELPLEFHSISGDFNISECRLTTLRGCPEYVGGTFKCDSNLLNSLEFGPKTVLSGYDASNNNLESMQYISQNPEMVDLSYNNIRSMEYCPKTRVYLDYNEVTTLSGCPPSMVLLSLYNNPITSLKNGPKYIKTNYYVSYSKIDSLEGAPVTVGLDMVAAHCYLTDLVGCPKVIGEDLDVTGNQLTTLMGLTPYIGGMLYLEDNPTPQLELYKTMLVNGEIPKEYQGLFNRMIPNMQAVLDASEVEVSDGTDLLQKLEELSK